MIDLAKTVRNPAFMASAAVPLVAGVVSTPNDSVRKASGLAAVVSAGLFIATGSEIAKNVAIGAGGAWALLRIL